MAKARCRIQFKEVINAEEEPGLFFSIILMIALAANSIDRGIAECCRPQKTLPPVKR
jgi:hypothetical protein